MTDDNGWEEYKRSVLHQLTEHGKKIDHLAEKVNTFIEEAPERFVREAECDGDERVEEDAYRRERFLLWSAVGGLYFAVFTILIRIFLIQGAQ